MKFYKKISNNKYFVPVFLTTIFIFSFLVYSTLQTFAQNISITNVAKTASVTVPKKTGIKISLELPILIKIPALKINAAVEHLGLTTDGAVDSPVGPDDVAWFDEGPVPGSIGSAVIDGHSGWKNNIPAVFDTLKMLKKGDKIYVINNKGVSTTFIVRELKAYGLNDNAPDVFISKDKKAHLNLITCTGVWNAKLKSHSSRLVVFTDKI